MTQAKIIIVALVVLLISHCPY